MSNDKFRHKVSYYEKASAKHRCGRAGLWQKPCHQGPDIKGGCGGTSECIPFLNGDRFECRRPLKAGGPCQTGPLPSGHCHHTHPPCHPQLSLKAWRYRIMGLLAILTLAFITMFAEFSPSDMSRISSLNPGELTSSHSNFISEETGCTSCHSSHEKNILQWIGSAFDEKDLSKNCLECHYFEGKQQLAHNQDFPKRSDIGVQKCTSCHVEHKGSKAVISKLSNKQCGRSCHQEKFDSFDGHSEFSKHFSSKKEQHIHYDHKSHANKYFHEPKYTKRAPRFAKQAKDDCTTCHMIEDSSHDIATANFTQICASCHENQIAERSMPLFQLPEIPQPFNNSLVKSTCKASNNSLDVEIQDTEYASLSDEEIQPMTELILGNVNPSEDNKNIQALLMTMASDGSAALTQQLEGRYAENRVKALFAGLSTELVQKVACHWMFNEEYSADEESNLSGWFAGDDGISIRYQATSHEDDVIKQWIELATEIKGNKAQTTLGKKLLDELLDKKEGAGACGKCHTSFQAEGKLHWGLHDKHRDPYTRFSHAPHIDILGRKDSCKTCHTSAKQVNDDVAVENQSTSVYLSDFSTIKKQVCADCHASNKVNDNCQVCHVYHTQSSFKKSMEFEH